ncbi:hypothetical protein [Aquabacterium sp. CECT 9606]|uniref:hypothetical protein n=1 Tax=Aquabacterium sp. CECT 9606 TaxID=2845822 RepID=UPI001E5C1598|nr:hypothetical protein [Aquabacterium sp. CECT 9606]CAH0351738.1 hypothetical protein AQB9606_02403 [Aquabacterium sp. CECT 9606]
MSTSKFEYVVSGVDLNDEQKAMVSNAIAAAVSHALLGSTSQVGAAPGGATSAPAQVLAKGKVWGAFGGGHGPINGGRLIFAATAAEVAELAKGVKLGH